MFVFDEKSTLRTLTPWGKEVKMRLLERNMQQNDLVSALQEKGFKVNKIVISQILYGIGASVRTEEIMEINRILKIPFEK